MTSAADPDGYESEIVDLNGVTLAELIRMDDPALRQSVRRVLDQLDPWGVTCGSQSAP